MPLEGDSKDGFLGSAMSGFPHTVGSNFSVSSSSLFSQLICQYGIVANLFTCYQFCHRVPANLYI